ncbi:hypothetical protein C2845_PM02G40470 [Panicum miliaceum]|uniref:Helicase CHR10 n=1 Tax=Panicum miliaceum TaxID=4540 RepID=A0A3L6S616_PANMI|nr:hypothetical protein C2845_PM02G40470 [Panicum miliaceum]
MADSRKQAEAGSGPTQQQQQQQQPSSCSSPLVEIWNLPLSRHPPHPPPRPSPCPKYPNSSPLFSMATSYERRLLAAADLVLSADAQGQGICLPDLGVTADLKPHQLDGVAWLIRRYRLGVKRRPRLTPAVVLCPLSVTDGWLSEFSKFCPSLRLLHYVGDKVHRRDLRRTLYDHVHKASTSSHSNELSFDELMTTYDIALMDQDFLSQIPWHYAIIDEAQRLKVPSSVLYNVLEQRFIMPRRLLLTGTPIQNNLSELWALMHFCLPSIFGKLDEFLSTFKEAGDSLTVCSIAYICRVLFMLVVSYDFLELRNYTYERLDGSVRAEERFAAIRNFSSQSTKGLMRDDNQIGAFVFMISTRAGGVGLNLIGADTVIFYEQDWNPQADKQALQRAHRIGQLNHVLSINLVSQRTIEEVIMRRAERKLKLSHNIIGEDDRTDVKGGDLGNEASDMRSIIFGLHLFDPADTTTETINEDTTSETINVEKLAKLKTMSEKVVMMRSHEPSEKDERAFEINPNFADGSGTVIRRASDSISVDPGLNEAAYLSWVKKFKEASHSIEDATAELGRHRAAPEEKFLKREVNKKKVEEKRKWETLGYKTLAVKEPDITASQNISDSGSVQLMYGDCTNPSKLCPAKPAIIFSCIDNSGTWGHGGMFDALTSLSTCIPDAYHRASEFDDLHMGDLHLIQLDEANCNRSLDAPLWVALAIVQSYNPRRKFPRSEISMPDLELCLSKAAFSAAQHSGSVPFWFLGIKLLRNLEHIFELPNTIPTLPNLCQLSICLLVQWGTRRHVSFRRDKIISMDPERKIRRYLVLIQLD